MKKLSKIAPEVTKVPRNHEVHKFAGVYLWAKGYQVEKFLGGGGFGSVWKCKSNDNPSEHIVVKVLLSNDAPAAITLEEINSVKILNDILDKDSDGKANRYLTGMNVIEETDGGFGSLIRSELAEGDLKAIFERKRDEDSQKPTQGPLKLSGVLRKARQALKSVQVLHNAGYSHNDIKPANFLRVQDWAMKKEKEDTVKSINAILESEQIDAKKVVQIKNIDINNKSLHQIEEITNSKKGDAQKIKEIREFINSKKLHKHSVQLSDFGTLTKISIVRGWGVWIDVYSSGYFCYRDYEIAKSKRLIIRDVQYADSELVAKRDVYALGVTLMNFLIDRIDDDALDKVKLLQRQTFNASDWKEIIKRYGEDSSENIQKYLQLIQKMVKQDYKERISLDDALEKLKKIR